MTTLSPLGSFQNKVSVEPLTLKDFLSIQPWITQRDTNQRVKKSTVRNNLETLRSPHLFVAIGELNKDDTDELGNEYSKGTRFIIDGNTRAYFWERNLTNELPEELIATIYKGDTLLDLRATYYAYDNPDATEQAAEVMTGIYRLLDFKPQSKKILGGTIVTSQNYASMWTFGAPLYGTNKGIWGIEPDVTETRTAAKRWAMAEQFKFWRNEWQYLDDFNIGGKASVIDQPVLMALLITSRVYAGDAKFAELIDNLNKKNYNPSERTAVSKIGEAATAQTYDVYTKNSASFDQYTSAFDFYIYWIERHMTNSTQTNCAAPKQGYTNKGKEWVYKNIEKTTTNLQAHFEL